MGKTVTQSNSLCPPPKYPNLDHPFNVCTGSSRRPTPTDFRHLRKPELSPEDIKTIEEIKEKGKGLAPEVLDSLVRGFVESKLRGVSPGADGFACAVGLERSGVEPGPAPGPGSGEKKAVATAPKKEAKVKRLKVAPGDVVKYAKDQGVKRSSVVIFRGLYRGSWWSNSSKLWVWHEPKHRNGRWNTGGVDDLVDRTGFSEKTVRSGLKELQDIDVIYKRAHGRQGVTNTIWELPKDKRHVMAWKRKPKRPKK
ncbi:hypothetical protein ES705_33114 [subsurface metagenome]|jgi:hypothetical protein